MSQYDFFQIINVTQTCEYNVKRQRNIETLVYIQTYLNILILTAVKNKQYYC